MPLAIAEAVLWASPLHRWPLPNQRGEQGHARPVWGQRPPAAAGTKAQSAAAAAAAAADIELRLGKV